jgi:hypothetical protein
MSKQFITHIVLRVGEKGLRELGLIFTTECHKMHSMRNIPVHTRNTIVATAIVDDQDYDLLSQFHWCLMKQKGYACQWTDQDQERYMHRLIMQPGPGLVVDHKDHHGLHNWRKNLRVVTVARNILHRKGPAKNGSSGLLGVTWHKCSSWWYGEITVDRHRFRRNFRSKEAAAIWVQQLRDAAIHNGLAAVQQLFEESRPSK